MTHSAEETAILPSGLTPEFWWDSTNERWKTVTPKVLLTAGVELQSGETDESLVVVQTTEQPANV